MYRLCTLGISDYCSKAPSFEVPWYATAQPLSSSRNQPLSPHTFSLFHASHGLWRGIASQACFWEVVKCNGHHCPLCRQSSIIVDALHLHCEAFPANREVVLFATCSVSVQKCSSPRLHRLEPRYIFRPSSLVSRKSWTYWTWKWMDDGCGSKQLKIINIWQQHLAYTMLCIFFANATSKSVSCTNRNSNICSAAVSTLIPACRFWYGKPGFEICE